MSWHPFELDHLAMEIVLKARSRDPKCLNQAYKMRMTCSYGLERFWGEHLRLADKEVAKAAFVEDTWKAFISAISKANPQISLPATMLSKNVDEELILAMTQQIWSLSILEHQACLSILTEFCNSIVWWTQRLKVTTGDY